MCITWISQKQNPVPLPWNSNVLKGKDTAVWVGKAKENSPEEKTGGLGRRKQNQRGK